MPERRDDLRILSARLLTLHTVLLADARHAYEATHGPTNPAALLRLLIHDEHFAWLRSLSALIAQIDEALDPREPAADIDVESFFQAAQGLLRSGDSGAFHMKYRDALQRSPELVMAHANVVKVLAGRATG